MSRPCPPDGAGPPWQTDESDALSTPPPPNSDPSPGRVAVPSAVVAEATRPPGGRTSLSTGKRSGGFGERLIEWGLFACAFLSVFVTVAIVLVLLNEGVYAVFGASARARDRAAEAAVVATESVGEEAGEALPEGDKGEVFGAFFEVVSLKEFFTETRWSPQYPGAGQHFGILPLLVGTLMVTGIASLIGLPIGLLSAIYLAEYASPRLRRTLKPILEVLAGIPTVVYGFFALVFVTPYVLRPILQDLMGFEVDTYNALSAGFVVGVMVIPMVCSLSEDALRAVPNSLREAGHALGATKFTVTTKIVVPAAISGIVASFLLAIARAIGETMAVALAAGNSPSVSLNPLLSHQTMTGFIAAIGGTDAVVGTIEYNSLYAVALCLFIATLVLNLVSSSVTRRFREVYQ